MHFLTVLSSITQVLKRNSRASKCVSLYPAYRMSIHQYLHKIPQLWKQYLLSKRILINPIHYFILNILNMNFFFKIQTWQRWFCFLKKTWAFKHSRSYITWTYLWRRSMLLWICIHIAVNAVPFTQPLQERISVTAGFSRLKFPFEN